MASLPVFDRLPEHRCFYGFTSSSTVCPSIAAFMASLPVFDRVPEHRCFYGFTSSSTVCLSIAAFMASLPVFDRLPEHRCFWGFTFLFDFTSSLTVCLRIAAFVASLSPFGVRPLITGSHFRSRSRRDVEVRLRPSGAARPCWTLFLFFLFPSRRRWTGPSLAATDKSGGDDAGRGRGKAPGVVRSKASGR